MRHPGTTAMGFFEGFLICTAIMGDSSSLTAAGRRSTKEERFCGSLGGGLQKEVEATTANHLERNEWI